MSTFNLDAVFRPRRIAVVPASDEENSPGGTIFRNLVAWGFRGAVYPINEAQETVFGVEAYPDLLTIPRPIDLAILCGDPERLVSDLELAVKKAVRGALLICSDFWTRVASAGDLISRLKALGEAHGLRLLGPNSLGFICPRLRLNVSVLPGRLPAGGLAFLSDSATLAAAVFDWAVDKNVGFSFFVSLGAKVDIDLADMIDFLGLDPATRAIVVYLEGLRSGRKFMSAARAFARAKPIMVVKGGRFAEGPASAQTPIGALITEDRVYEAAFKRAGVIQVEEVLDLFHLAESLAKQPRPRGPRLAIITNARGPATLATDALIKYQGVLASFSEETVKNLARVVPAEVIGNPLDLLSGASPKRYRLAISTCLQDKAVDGVLVIHAPVLQISAEDVAWAIVKASKAQLQKPVFASLMGKARVADGRRILKDQNIPSFVTPVEAVKSFVYMHRYDRNLRLLYETPGTLLEDFCPLREKVREVVLTAARQGRYRLNFSESLKILEAYQIETLDYQVVFSRQEAVAAARRIGFPVVLKVNSIDILHKRASGAVALYLFGPEQVARAFEEILSNVRERAPCARIEGVIVQKMIRWPGFDLALGARKSETFGSVILFGAGGELIHSLRHCAVGLPPLNQTLARRLMEEAAIYEDLSRDDTLDLRLLEKTLVRLSHLIIDFPEIKELHVNPLFFCEAGVYALDARIIIEEFSSLFPERPKGVFCPAHLSLCPYPDHFVFGTRLKDGRKVRLRPIRPEDEPLMAELFRTFSEETIRFRFLESKLFMPHEELIHYCQIDYDRELALVAEIKEDRRLRIIGVVRLVRYPDEQSAEMAVVVGDPWQGKGLGQALCRFMIQVARDLGLKRIFMEIMPANSRMMALARKLKFKMMEADEDIVRMVLDLVPEGGP